MRPDNAGPYTDGTNCRGGKCKTLIADQISEPGKIDEPNLKGGKWQRPKLNNVSDMLI